MSVPLLVEAFPRSAAVGEGLGRAGLSVAVAESCTGGLLGAVLTAVPGSSAVMLGGVIAYADSVKRDQLGVGSDLLARCGAVSEAVAVAMAEGVRARLGADLGVGITGVAGPGAEGSEKPAGLIFVALASSAGTTVVQLGGDHGREANRAAAVDAALGLLAAAAAGTPP